LAGIALLVLNQLHIFVQMCQDMGFLLVALGLSGALGQVFIFVTIAKFGALTCSIIGLARKVTTLVASIYIYGHELNGIQFTGLLISVLSMLMNFWKKKEKKADPILESGPLPEEMQQMLGEYKDEEEDAGDVELASAGQQKS
jgi:UDP-galactose transporter B1